MKTAVSGGAAVAGSLLLPSSPSQGARPRRRKTHTVRFTLRRAYHFPHSNYRLERLAIQTRSDRLKRFLTDKRNAKHVETAVRAVLKKSSCRDLQNGKRLARLQNRVAKALARLHKKRTRRYAAVPVVTLFVTVPYARCKGDCPAPVPYCKAP